MLLEHRGRRPTIDASAYVAPTAVVCGDVTVGPGSRILFGAVITAEEGRVEIRSNCIVMENALVRGRKRHPTRLGSNVLVGPHAHVNGAAINDDVFIATGASVFPGARVGERCEIRIGAVVHVNSRLEPDTVVPIHWIAAGDPARLFAPADHDDLWAVQKGLDFPGTVFGLPRSPEGGTLMPEAMRRYSEAFDAHRDDRRID